MYVWQWRYSPPVGLSARLQLNTCRSQTPYALDSNSQEEQDPHTHTQESSFGYAEVWKAQQVKQQTCALWVSSVSNT